MARRHRQPNPGFMAAAAQKNGPSISESLLRQARKSGQLNLSNRSLEVSPTPASHLSCLIATKHSSPSIPSSQDIPRSVWRINIDPPSDDVVSFSAAGDDRWWEQTDLTKLILAGNLLRSLSEDVRCLPALTVLDVCGGGEGRWEGGEIRSAHV